MDFQKAASLINCDQNAVKAVYMVESRGKGFDPDGFPITLFEGHIFHKLTNGKFSAEHPTLSYLRWTKEHYGKTWQAEKLRLQQATKLDRTAALKSASWGLFQILGLNFSSCNCKSIQEFVNRNCASEQSQLELFIDFVLNQGLDDELRNHDWAGFARIYNGPAYKLNKYDTKLKAAYDSLR